MSKQLAAEKIAALLHKKEKQLSLTAGENKLNLKQTWICTVSNKRLMLEAMEAHRSKVTLSNPFKNDVEIQFSIRYQAGDRQHAFIKPARAFSYTPCGWFHTEWLARTIIEDVVAIA